MTEPRLSCRDAIEQLWAYIDQELDPGTSDQVRAHLERCQHCFPQYDFHRAFCEFLKAKCREEAPAELRRRIFMQLLKEEHPSN
jgi:mycothiol system anti-sigma-R factor